MAAFDASDIPSPALAAPVLASACRDVVDHAGQLADDVVNDCRLDSCASADRFVACDVLVASVVHSLAFATLAAVDCVDPVAARSTAAVVDLAAAAGQGCVVHLLAAALPVATQ